MTASRAAGGAGGEPWLVLDTSTPIAVVGVVAGAVAIAEHRLSEPKRHAEGLIDAIDRVLLAAGVPLDDVRGVAVGRGPGSFIGVRTGIATAKGICLGRGIPLVGLPSLVALSLSVWGVPAGRGLAVVDAKRGEVYAQLVESGAEGGVIATSVVRAIEPAVALSPADAVARARGLAFVVGALEGLDEDVARFDVTSPSAEGLARALVDRLRDEDALVDEVATLVPDYCRAPDAKLPRVDPAARRPADT